MIMNSMICIVLCGKAQSQKYVLKIGSACNNYGSSNLINSTITSSHLKFTQNGPDSKTKVWKTGHIAEGNQNPFLNYLLLCIPFSL